MLYMHLHTYVSNTYTKIFFKIDIDVIKRIPIKELASTPRYDKLMTNSKPSIIKLDRKLIPMYDDTFLSNKSNLFK